MIHLLILGLGAMVASAVFGVDDAIAAVSALGSLFGHHSNPQQTAAANYQNFQLQQAQNAAPALQNVLGLYAQMAGLNYQPVTNNGGGSALTVNQNYNPFQSSLYQNSFNQLKQQNQQAYNQAMPGIATQALKGLYQKGYSAQSLRNQQALGQQQFNENFLGNDIQNRQNMLGNITNILSGMSGQGQPAAQNLYNIGQNQQQQQMLQNQQLFQTLQQIFKDGFANQAAGGAVGGATGGAAAGTAAGGLIGGTDPLSALPLGATYWGD